MDNKEDDTGVYLIEEMENLSDMELVKVGLASLAVLHNRAVEVETEEGDTEVKAGSKVFNREEYIAKHGSADTIPESTES